MWTTTTLKKTFKLSRLYRELNEGYFGGVLGDCSFEAVPDPCSFIPAVAAVSPHKKWTGGYAATIRFNSRIDWDEKDIRRVLLHEMIHYYIYVRTGRRLAFPHGLRFVVTMLKINIQHRERIRMYWHGGKLTWSEDRSGSTEQCQSDLICG